MITMGYGHLTIITMGLGNAFLPGHLERRVQFGAVEFHNIPTNISAKEISINIGIEQERQQVEDADIETEVRYG